MVFLSALLKLHFMYSTLVLHSLEPLVSKVFSPHISLKLVLAELLFIHVLNLQLFTCFLFLLSSPLLSVLLYPFLFLSPSFFTRFSSSMSFQQQLIIQPRGNNGRMYTTFQMSRTDSHRHHLDFNLCTTF